MIKRIVIVFTLFTLGLAACSSPTAAPAALTSTVPAEVVTKSGTYRFAFSGEMNVRDVPLLMAFESLEAQGYTVERLSLAEADLVPEAMVRGDADLGSFSVRNTWPAIVDGAELRAIAASWMSTFSIVVRKNIQSCADLEGVAVAFTSPRGINQVLMHKHFEQNCPGTEPQILALGNSSARSAALLAGEIDAAQLETVNRLELERQAPGEFHTLINFGQEFPEVYISSFGVRREWAESNPEMVKDFLKALLLAQRAINDEPGLLVDQIIKHLPYEPADAQEIADAYLNPNIWYLNGGLTPEAAQYNIDLLIETEDLPAGVKVEDVADLSYLNAVLDEIGIR